MQLLLLVQTVAGSSLLLLILLTKSMHLHSMYQLHLGCCRERCIQSHNHLLLIISSYLQG